MDARTNFLKTPEDVMEDAGKIDYVVEELSIDEMSQIAGGGLTEWGVAIGAAMGFAGLAIGAAATAPVVAGVAIGASFASSGLSIFYYQR